MVAYNFQKRFVGHLQAGLEPGPWCPGMKRHTLRKPRKGRQGHARPEQPVQLYFAQRTQHCRMIGKAVARVQIPVLVMWDGKRLGLMRNEGAAPRSRVADLAPVVQQLLAEPTTTLWGEAMDAFARTDGFADAAEMAAFFDPPEFKPAPANLVIGMSMILIGWSPAESDD